MHSIICSFSCQFIRYILFLIIERAYMILSHTYVKFGGAESYLSDTWTLLLNFAIIGGRTEVKPVFKPDISTLYNPSATWFKEQLSVALRVTGS